VLDEDQVGGVQAAQFSGGVARQELGDAGTLQFFS
jgi:hypothetical protein